MTLEAWLGLAAFVVLFAAWSLLPSRFLQRRRGEGAARASPTAEVVQALTPPPGAAAVPAAASLSPNGLAQRGQEFPRIPARFSRWPNPVEVRLVRNPSFHPGSGEETPRYFYLVRLPGMASEARLPVYWNPRPASPDVLVREAYRVRVAGQTLEAGNLHVLGDLVRSTLAGLGAPGQPPRFWLLHRSSAVPVYWQGGTYEALTDGPRLWGRDLQELRDRYAYYLASCNGGPGGPVTVALLSFADLDVHGPEAVLEGPGVWAPVFPEDGTLVAFGPGQTTWSAPHSPAGVLSLWEAASRQLALCGKLADPASLWLAEVSEACHGALMQASTPTGLALRLVRLDGAGADRVRLAVRRVGHLVFASCPQRSCLHVAPDLGTLREGVARHLAEAWAVAGPPELAVEESPGPAPRASWSAASLSAVPSA